MRPLPAYSYCQCEQCGDTLAYMRLLRFSRTRRHSREVIASTKQLTKKDKKDSDIPNIEEEEVAAGSPILTMEVEAVTLTQQPASALPDEAKALSDDMINKELEADTANPMEEIDEGDGISMPTTNLPVAPSNTPITGDSGQTSPVMEVSSDGLSDDNQKEQSATPAEATSQEKPLTNGQAEGPTAKSAQGASVRPGAAVTNGAIPKENKKEEKKSSSSGNRSKRKEEKGGIDSILRALNSLESPEEKLAAICKRYADLHEEHRVLQTSFKTQQRSIASLVKERDQISSEHAKAIIAKGRLESLCRELQKHNKLVKEESIQRAKEDDEKRRELSTKFQTTIGEIQTQMSSNNERNSKLQEENMALAKQLKQFVEQYEVREQKVRQHRDLEQQVAEAKIAKANAILKEEQERSAKEKELLLHKIGESNKKVNLLESQVRVFKDRYDDFENLHTRSNETFQKYKTEMDKMGKRVKKLEKDGLAWKSKWESTNKALIEAMDSRSKSEKETKTWVQKTKTLESLCRALQEKLHEKPSAPQTEAPKEDGSPTSEVPPNSPEAPSSGQASPDSAVTPSSEENLGSNPANPPPTVSPPSESQNEEEPVTETSSSAAADASTAPASQESSSSSPPPSSSGEAELAESTASSTSVPSESQLPAESATETPVS